MTRSIPRPGVAAARLACTLCAALLLGTGCGALGPGSIPRDRFDYNQAIAHSWKHQALHNIVKIRYLDVPIWLDVGQVVSGYSLETSVSLGGQLSSADAIQGDSASLGTAARFTDRPTITYAPLTGDRFIEAFLTPIAPEKLFSLIQAGYAADFILELGLDSISGLRNHSTRVGTTDSADAEFFRATALLREIQDAAAIGLHVEPGADGRPSTLVVFREERVSPEVAAKFAELRALLGVRSGLTRLPLVFSPLHAGDDVLTVGTRSVMQLLSALSLGVEIPEEHRERGLALATAGSDPSRPPLLVVHSGRDRPERAFIATEYEGAWFWIAEDDWRSKRTFTSIIFLFSLASSGAGSNLPTITIPAQ